ncbi:MAG TPA: PKD domain-containing protein [Flavipsychrobacter sp.]|nr:PKD domain-containing protein [Flavipsychrobacter sp.]
MIRLLRCCLILLFVFAFSAVKAQLTANFNVNDSVGCSPMIVQFINTSTGGASSYSWNFGDNTNSSLTSPSHVYTSPGTYTITLTASNGTTTHSKSRKVVVLSSPIVDFTASAFAGCPPLTVTFTDNSNPVVPGPATYSWAFGDGNTSTLQSPTHTFTQPGTYHITEAVKNSGGCVTSKVKSAYIKVHTPPVADFNFNRVCKAPGIATFTTSVTGTPPYTFSWTYGDGNTGTGNNPSHTYANPGTYNVRMVVEDANGCKDTVIKPFSVGTLKASFTAPAQACKGIGVLFTNTSVNPGGGNLWNFGDGGFSTSTSPVHAFANAGTYTVKLIVTDASGLCPDTFSKNIIILPGPTASFNITPPAPCPAPATLNFNNTSTNGAVSYSWNFGDGNTSTATSPTHTMLYNGVYFVILTATDANGCTDKDTIIYNLPDLIAAPGILGNYSRCAPSSINFTNGVNYPHPISSYVWDFGDGSPPGSGASPNHTYTTGGNYTVTLIVTSSNGCKDTGVLQVKIGEVPVETYSMPSDTMCAPGGFWLTPQPGTADSFFWYVVDHLGDTIQKSTTLGPPLSPFVIITPLYNPAGSGPPPHYYYPPWFTVIMVASDNGCLSVPFKDTMTVKASYPLPGAEADCDTPTLVRFGDHTIDRVDARIWDFGDGSATDTSKNPVHIYPALGNYTVRLTIVNYVTGCTTFKVFPLKLYVPTADFWANDTAVCVQDTVGLDQTFSDAIKYYSYSFTPSNVNYLSHGITRPKDSVVFRSGGIYTVKLSWVDINDCPHDTTKTSYIIVGNPSANFTAKPPLGCHPFLGKFKDNPGNTPGLYTTNWQWDFGDGSTLNANTDSVTHLYNTSGLHDVRVIITDNIGCIDTLLRLGYVDVRKSTAKFGADDTTACVGQPVQFLDSATSSSGAPLTHFWDFGDGSTSTLRTPSHVYTQAGSYNVMLVVKDDIGCNDTVIYPNYIKVQDVNASFTMSDTFALCPPLNIQFTNTSTGASNYQWAFGDGSGSIVNNPMNIYVTPGLYNIRLIAISSYGCRDTAYGRANLMGYAGALTYAPTKGCNPLTVNFNATLTGVSNFLWDYSDGNIVIGSGLTSTHTYTTPGKFLPKLIFTDSLGCVNSSDGIDTIYVDDIIADFVTSPACINTPITFYDTSYSYFSSATNWSWNINGQVFTDQKQVIANFQSPGSYPVTFIVKNANGCTDTLTENITILPLPTVVASEDTIICLGDAATLSGSGAASYTWSPANDLSCVACQTTKASPTIPRTYTVTGVDANGCQNRDSVKVNLKTVTTSDVGPGGEICKDSSIQLLASGATRYEWSPAASLDNANIANPKATPTESTYYTVLAWEGSCLPDTNIVNVIVHPLPTVNAGTDETIVAGNTVRLNASGSLIDKYRWSPPEDLSCSDCSSPVASPFATTNYVVTVTSKYGCVAKDMVTIHVLCDQSQLFIPNTFSPNGDGENDVFYPRGKGLSSITAFRVYNRWGEMVFERKNIQLNDEGSAWNGTYKGVQLDPDVFVYVVEGICASGENMTWKGDINLVR